MSQVDFSDDEMEDQEPQTADSEERLRTAFEAVKRRCAAADILCEEAETASGNKYVRVCLPSGRDKRPINVFSLKQAQDLLLIHFEDYVVLSGYDAICSYAEGTIEAIIRPLHPLAASSIQRVLFGMERPLEKQMPIVLRQPGISGETVSLGLASSECVHLTANYGLLHQRSVLAIKIEGLNISRHDSAIDYLERLSNSLFFQIDLALDLPLTLARERRFLDKRAVVRTAAKMDLEFPRFEYDREPMSLYWYAKSALGMPLLQFLAYYQAIEVYFPTFSQMDAQKRIRNIIKDPSFNPHKDADIGRVLTAIRVSSHKAFGDERSQLRATIQECVTSDELRGFLTEDASRREFYSQKHKTISEHRIALANPQADLRNDVADRIYDIRCKIVHTKNVGEESELSLLLPFSEEADLLIHDIELAGYLAQRVIITSSTQLRQPM